MTRERIFRSAAATVEQIMNREGQQGTECHLDNLYQQVVMVHARDPSGTTSLPEVTLRAEGYNPACGDELTLSVCASPPIATEDRLDGVQIVVLGCSICRASGSILWQRIQNRSVGEIRALIHHFREILEGATPDQELLGDAAAMRGVARFPVRMDCALLPWTTLEDALGQLSTNKAP